MQESQSRHRVRVSGFQLAALAPAGEASGDLEGGLPSNKALS